MWRSTYAVAHPREPVPHLHFSHCLVKVTVSHEIVMLNCHSFSVAGRNYK